MKEVTHARSHSEWSSQHGNAHAERTAQVEPVLVRATVRDGRVHDPQQLGVYGPPGVEVEEAGAASRVSALNGRTR